MSRLLAIAHSSGTFGTPNPTYTIDALIASHSPNASAGVKKVCALASSPSVGLKLTANLQGQTLVLSVERDI